MKPKPLKHNQEGISVPSLQITSKSDEVIRIDYKDVYIGWEGDILFLSDVHIDSPWCDRKLLKHHLDEAVEKNAVILIAGDLFDGMQGPNDPRRSYRELKESLKGNDYFDRILDDALEFFAPYAANLGMVGYGNHEYSIVRHNGTDLTQRFVGALRRDTGSPVVAGGYGGFIRLSVFDTMQTPSASMWIYYNHGAGGDAPVSQGAIQTNRQAAWLLNCDLVWNGHNHKSYVMSQSTMGRPIKTLCARGFCTSSERQDTRTKCRSPRMDTRPVRTCHQRRAVACGASSATTGGSN